MSDTCKKGNWTLKKRHLWKQSRIFFGVSLVLCQVFQTKFLSVFFVSWHLVLFFLWILLQVKHWVIFKIFPAFFLSVFCTLFCFLSFTFTSVFLKTPKLKKAGKIFKNHPVFNTWSKKLKRRKIKTKYQETLSVRHL